jgi:hypothetical protein
MEHPAIRPPRPDESLNPKGSPWADIGVTSVVTVLTAVVCWRVAVAMQSPLALAGLFAAPAALSAKSLRLASASLLALFCFSAAVLFSTPRWAEGMASFVFVFVCLVTALLYLDFVAGGRLNDARSALSSSRAYSKRARLAIDASGVCIIVLDKQLAWLSVNESAWSAFGCDQKLRMEGDERVDLDDEAVSALMNSGSRACWRELLETANSDSRAPESPKPQSRTHPRMVSLYPCVGEPTAYRFVVTSFPDGKMVFVGTPQVDATRGMEFVPLIGPN